MTLRGYTAVLLISGAFASGVAAPEAHAFDPIKPVCTVAGWVNGLFGKACSVVRNGGRYLDASKKLLTGHVGSAVKTALGDSTKAAALTSGVTAAGALAAIGLWVSGGARSVLQAIASVLGKTTTPRLGSPWFTATYWRVAGIAAVLTLPFLFAAAIQALVRSDITLLLRAALGYLPLAMLAVAIAAPLTALLLAVSDQLASIVSSAAGNESAHFLSRSSGIIGSLTGVAESPFLGVFACLLTVAGGFALWLELVMREAAVYVIALMLPLAFAALVWPARRVWAVRAVEVLVALILSKFAIVAVLSLGGAALGQSIGHSLTGVVAGIAMLSLGAFAPWALLRLLPLAEIASGAAGSLRNELRGASGSSNRAGTWGEESHDWSARTAQMRRDADEPTHPEAAGAHKERLDEMAPAANGQHAGGRDPAAQSAGSEATSTDSLQTSPVVSGQSSGASASASADGPHVEPASPGPTPGSDPDTVRLDRSAGGEADSPSDPGAQVREASPQAEAPDTDDGPVLDLEQLSAHNADPGDADTPDPTPPPQPREDGHL